MRKSGMIITLAMMSVLILSACTSGTEDIGPIRTETPTQEQTTQEQTKKVEKPLSAEEQYQNILDTYSAKIREATPILVNEYYEEAKLNTNGINGLAEISIDKTSELAQISIDGTGEMANVMFNSGSGSYSDYEAWATQLTNVYMEEAAKISDAYMSSAMQ